MRVGFVSFRRRKSKCGFDVFRFFIHCGGKCKLGQALHTPSDEHGRRQFRRTIYRAVFYDYFIRKPFYPVRIFVYRRQKKQKKNTARRTALVVHTPAYRPYRFSFSRSKSNARSFFGGGIRHRHARAVYLKNCRSFYHSNIAVSLSDTAAGYTEKTSLRIYPHARFRRQYFYLCRRRHIAFFSVYGGIYHRLSVAPAQAHGFSHNAFFYNGIALFALRRADNQFRSDERIPHRRIQSVFGKRAPRLCLSSVFNTVVSHHSAHE